MNYEPEFKVPADLLHWMRSVASRSAFIAAMLDVNRRRGGLKQSQIDELAAQRAHSMMHPAKS